MAPRSVWAWLSRRTAQQTHEVLFAEAAAQALAAGMDVSGAIVTAADAVPDRRLRAALTDLARHCRNGYGFDTARDTGVGGELLAALDVGEQRGCLAEQLERFARRHDPRPRARLAAAVGRPAEATRFAAALAGLLADRRLTVGLVVDAGRLAAGDGSPFAAAVGRVAEAMACGQSLADALGREPGWFDPLYRRLVAVPDGRDGLRAVLARLGDDGRPA